MVAIINKYKIEMIEMIEKLLVWKIYSGADVFGVKSYASENGRKAFSSAMLFRGLTGNYLE